MGVGYHPGNYYFLIPWVLLIPWYGMLITMLSCWSIQGHPIYWFMHDDQFPVYISDIGATNLQPLFIACVAWQGLWYCIMVAAEFFQRSGHWPFQWLAYTRREQTSYSGSTTPVDDMESQRVGYAELLSSRRFLMPPYFTKHERNLIGAAFGLGFLGEVALLMCSIFSTASYHVLHVTMVGCFVVFMFFSINCSAVQYFIMGRHYAQLHPLAPPEALNVKTSWRRWVGYYWNKYTISAIAKTIWLVFAAVWALCFGFVQNKSVSASFEWILAFWIGAYYIIVSVDFYLGSRYMHSKYFHQIQSFTGYYKYDQLVLSEAKVRVEKHAWQEDRIPNLPEDDETEYVV
ncbi:HDR114Wp [Eremothecium sinecaudum]|uniref:HDR114Wp n=1 Tax=Eremothecium sinecaudum TaxID=45286 RepID=A0A0X8HSW7_9SACH|nr:HDR114Wp [Eremothecium sinecaudum]AMD20856.1 HDR114Wp [Eremothecium sinecaudum]